MKSRQSQTGSAHLAIIIVLVVALLGALGFVFWQNFINKPVANQSGTAQTSTQTTTDKTLAVSEWGVVGSYTQASSNVEGLNYKFEKIDSSTNKTVTASATDTGAYLAITSPALDSLCGGGAGFAITRATGDASMSASVGSPESTAADVYNSINVPNINYSAKAHVGNYYYFLTAPQGSCTDANSADTSQADVLGVAKDFLKNLKAE